MSDRLAVRKTYKLYLGGTFPRSESGRTYEVTDARGHFLANAAWASRKDARDAVVAARGAFARWSGADRLQPRPGALPGGRGDGGPARPSSPRRSPPARACRRPRPGPPWTPRSTAGSGTPGGPTSWPRCSAGPTRSPGPYFDFSVPEPTGVVAVLAPQQSSLLGPGQRAGAGAGHRQHRRRGDARRTGRCRRSPWPRCWPPPTCPAGWSTCSPATPPRSAPGWPSTPTSTASTSPAHRDGGHGARARGRRHASSGCVRPPATEPDWTADPGLSRMTPFLETKTVWHPMGV